MLRSAASPSRGPRPYRADESRTCGCLCHNDLLSANFIDDGTGSDRRLGVCRHGRPVLRPGQLRREPRLDEQGDGPAGRVLRRRRATRPSPSCTTCGSCPTSARRCGESSSRRSRRRLRLHRRTPEHFDAGRWREFPAACAGGRRRRRRRRLLDPLLADPARLGRRRPGRARRPDQRLDVPLGGARRPAARLAQPDADDDELGRAVPDARRRGRPRDGLARGRLAAARLVGGADGGAAPPGGLGEDVRAAARADLGRGGAAAVPADVDRRRARRRLPPDRRLHRPEPADLRARRGRAARRREIYTHTRVTADRRRARPGDRASRPTRADRDRGRRQRRRHVRGARSGGWPA